MTEKMEFTPAEQTLCHRLVTLVAGTVGRALGEARVPLTDQQENLTRDATSRAAINLIAYLREREEGIPCEEQDTWVGAVVLAILHDIWGVTPREPTPEERRLKMKLLN